MRELMLTIEGTNYPIHGTLHRGNIVGARKVAKELLDDFRSADRVVIWRQGAIAEVVWSKRLHHILKTIRKVSHAYYLTETKGGHGAHTQLFHASNELFRYFTTRDEIERAKSIAWAYRDQHKEWQP